MSFFQSPAYYELMKELSEGEPFHQRLKSSAGDQSVILTGVRVANGGKFKKYFTSRIVIIGEPFTATNENLDTDNTIDWQFRKQPGGKSIYTEFRLLEPPGNKVFFHSLPFTFCLPYLNILIDTTPSVPDLYSNLSASKKRQVQSSKKAGAFVRAAGNEKEVESFYRILKELYTDKIKKPLIAEEVLMRVFRDKSIGEILLVVFNEKIIGGMLCPVFEKQEMYEWYIGCKDDEMKKHKVYPSVLVTWEAIKYASIHGFKRFNFMGAGIKGKPYGVRDFKMQFGGKLVDAPRYIFVHKPFLYKLGKLAVRLGLGE